MIQENWNLSKHKEIMKGKRVKVLIKKKQIKMKIANINFKTRQIVNKVILK